MHTCRWFETHVPLLFQQQWRLLCELNVLGNKHAYTKNSASKHAVDGLQLLFRLNLSIFVYEVILKLSVVQVLYLFIYYLL